MEGETVEDDHVPTDANKKFQQSSKELDTDEISEERDSNYDDQFDDLPDTEDVIFDRRGKKLFLETMMKTMTMIVTTCPMILTVILKIMIMKWF